MTEGHKAKQEMFLQEFIGSYKGFQSGKGMSVAKYEDYRSTNVELLDKSYFIHLGLALSSPDTIIYEEVGILGQSGHALPHGYIDLLAFSQNLPKLAVGLHCLLDGKTVTGTCSQITTTSLKTNHTYGNPGSERQAIVELLAFSQVLLKSNPNIRCCVMLKVSKYLCRPYFYLPQHDVLLRTNSDIQLNSPADYTGINHELIGSFIFSLIMLHIFNTRLFEDLKATKCGWEEVYKASGASYHCCISPQKYSKKILIPLSEVNQLKRSFMSLNIVNLIIKERMVRL